MTGFKVLIAGGGPVGLTAALALSRAKIPFTLLEKYRSIVPEAGSDLVLSPIGLRALSQLGVYNELSAVSTPLGAIQRIDHDGNDLGQFKVFEVLKEQFGQAPRVLRRQDMCQVIYNAIPDRENILCSKEIREIQETEHGVTATCADGSTHTADLIIGADGVHSAVRKQITSDNNNHNKNKTSECPSSDTSSGGVDDVFTAHYRCVWMRFSVLPGMPVGGTFETHGPGASTQMFVSEDHAVAGIYERLYKPIDRRVLFTKEDEDEVMRRWADLPMLPDGSVTLGDAYSHKIASGIVPLQEGVRDCWMSSGARMLLAGDAAHAFSPITGAGCNQGIIDVVVLSNKLRGLLDVVTAQNAATTTTTTLLPTVQQLADTFSSYQEARKGPVSRECQIAMSMTNTASWVSIVRRLADQYILSMEWLQRYLMRYAIANIAKTPSFDFLPADENVVGKMPWQANL